MTSSINTRRSEYFLILRRTERDMLKRVHCSSWKVHVIADISLYNFNFTDGYSSNATISYFMEIRSVGFDLFMGQKEEQTERQINMINFKATYRNFSNAIVRGISYLTQSLSLLSVHYSSKFKFQTTMKNEVG